jgi:hypothetical protein
MWPYILSAVPSIALVAAMWWGPNLYEWVYRRRMAALERKGGG